MILQLLKTIQIKNSSYNKKRRYNVRARFLTYTETENLENAEYLYENLSEEDTEEQPYGYWLSTIYYSDRDGVCYAFCNATSYK